MSFTKLKSRGRSLPEGVGKKSDPSPFPVFTPFQSLLLHPLHSVAHGPFFYLQSQQGGIFRFLCSVTSPSPLSVVKSLCPLLVRTPVPIFDSHRQSRISPPSQDPQLPQIHKSLSALSGNVHGLSGLGPGNLCVWGGALIFL